MTASRTTLAERISRLEDQPGVGFQEEHTIGQFCGDWVSTNQSTRGIAKIKIRTTENGLSVHAFGASEPALSDCGIAPAQVVTDGSTSPRIRAFLAFYEFGF